MTPPAKGHVRRAFDRAAASYDTAAGVQRRVCARLALNLPATMTPGVILDAGCGTGYALRLLRERFPSTHLIGLDFAPAMLARARRLAHRLCGDVERLPLAAKSIDLYWSSLTLQWCRLPQALTEARHALRDDGYLALATLGPQTFGELRHAFAAADAYRHTLRFMTPEDIAQAAEQAGFQTIRLERETQTAYYGNLKAALRAIKAVGANQVGGERRRGLMSRQIWQRVEAAYETFRQPQGLPLTYDIITLQARK